ncbi:hypothetical protein [Microbulbifer variabilis]|uniref:hypothetical protein n=1 Tax=Microbulbifer variabilis TaxID=266805 RepID=UPI001CFD7002|nr:hypothetical protein [Microbulbifer variabilis]
MLKPTRASISRQMKQVQKANGGARSGETEEAQGGNSLSQTRPNVTRRFGGAMVRASVRPLLAIRRKLLEARLYSSNRSAGQIGRFYSETEIREMVSTKLGDISTQEREKLLKAITKLQACARDNMQQRKSMSADKLRALLLEPNKGGQASRNSPTYIVGGIVQEPQNYSDVRSFPEKTANSRDEYRRVLESTIAEELLSPSRTNYVKIKKIMEDTERKLKTWVENHIAKNGNENALAVFLAMYTDGVTPRAYEVNNQLAQFASATYQAKEDKDDLALLGTRCAGLMQCIAWLSHEVTDADAKRQDRRNKIVYHNHKFFGKGRGREDSPNKLKGTKYKGIIKSEEYAPVQEQHKTQIPLTKAQINSIPSVIVAEKPQGRERRIPAWLKNSKARTMPFVNSISGLGLVSSLSDSLSLIPKEYDDKLNFYTLVAAAQLYTLGGHSLFEFMEGVRLGQDVKAYNQSENTDSSQNVDRSNKKFIAMIRKDRLPRANHGLDYESFVNQIPKEVLNQAAKSMKEATANTKV